MKKLNEIDEADELQRVRLGDGFMSVLSKDLSGSKEKEVTQKEEHNIRQELEKLLQISPEE